MGRSRALLTLAVFLSWLGGAVFHTHPVAAAPCKVCHALQVNQADLPDRASAPNLLRTVERIAATTGSQTSDVLLRVPQGRAPPLV